MAISGLHRFSRGLLLLSRMGTGLVPAAGSPRDSQDAARSPTIAGQGYAPLPRMEGTPWKGAGLQPFCRYPTQESLPLGENWKDGGRGGKK